MKTSKIDTNQIHENECYLVIDTHIHTSNVIGEDDEYYYTVPTGNIRKVLKTDVRFDIKELLTENIIYKLENNIKISKNKRKELVDEILKDLEKTHAEYLI